MTRMFNPPHPGLTLRDDVLPALGLEQEIGDVRHLDLWHPEDLGIANPEQRRRQDQTFAVFSETILVVV